MEIKNKSSNLNLQQQSQLMYGVTKIYKKQVMQYEKDVFETGKKFYSKEKEITDPWSSGSGLVSLRDDLIDLIDSSIDESYLISELGNEKDLHLFQEVDLDREQEFVSGLYEMKGQGHTDFGAWNEMEFMDMIEAMNRNESIFLIRSQTVQGKDSVREPDIIDDIEIAEEVHREGYMSQESNFSFRNVSLVDVEERRKELASTPQKRQPHHIRAETPTKRRRLSIGTAVATDLIPPEKVRAPEIYVTEAATSLLPAEEVQVPKNMEIEKLEYEESDRRIKKPKKLKIDKKKLLKSDMMKQWQQNTRIHCVEFKKTKHVEYAKDLLKQPAKRWGTTLKNELFDNIIMKAIEDLSRKSRELNAVQEAPQQMIMASFTERSVVERMHSSFPADNSAAHTILNIHPTINDMIQEAEETSTILLATESIPHITVLEDNIELHQDQEKIPDTILLDTERQRATTRDGISKSSIFSPMQLTLEEILAMVEKETQTTEFIKFEQFMPINKYSKEEVANAFYLLLVAHMRKKIVLQQEAYLCDLWIRKYLVYSDSD